MTETNSRVLPLESSPALVEGGWTISLPVRAEHVSVLKETVVTERVVVRTRRSKQVWRGEAALRREHLITGRENDVIVTDEP
jgi:stress response protein YsnF